MRHVIVLDEGTTSARAVLISERGEVVAEATRKLAIHTPAGLCVEQDPAEIVASSIAVLREVLDVATAEGCEPECLAITNQRTATAVLDANTGTPVGSMVSWQDGRADEFVRGLRPRWAARFQEVTRGNLSASNVAIHAAALLQDPELARRAARGDIVLAAPDSLVLMALTGRHLTSTSNASADGAMDFDRRDWWTDWLDHLGVPRAMFPPILDDDGDFGVTLGSVLGHELPVRAVVADQQAALFGQGGFRPGGVKCTHGTGTFIDFNIGDRVPPVLHGMDLRVAWNTAFSRTNCIEGASLVSGSAIEWLVDDMRLLSGPADVDDLCRAATPSGLVVVPALAGFASPHWDSASRGSVLGLSRHTSREQFVEATVTGIAHAVVDLLDAMWNASGVAPAVLTVDGGLSRSDYLQQRTADLAGIPVERTADAAHATARGAAWIAGIAAGVWPDAETAARGLSVERRFEPRMDAAERSTRRGAWVDAVGRTLGWRAEVAEVPPAAERTLG